MGITTGPHDLDDSKTYSRLKFEFLEAVTLDPDLAPLERQIANRLIRYLNHRKRTAWPGAKNLSEELHVTERSVRRSLKSLVEKRWFFLAAAGGGRRGGTEIGRANEYRPNWQRVTTESGLTGTGANKPESEAETLTQESAYPDSGRPHTLTPESSQTLEETSKENLKGAPATSPPPTPEAPATAPPLGEDLDASPGSIVDASKEKRVAQTPNIGAELRDQAKKAEVRQQASADLHTFLMKVLGESGYLEWVSHTSPEAEARLAKHLEGAPRKGKARRQHELRLLRMIEGGGSGDDDAVDERGDTLDQQVVAAGSAA